MLVTKSDLPMKYVKIMLLRRRLMLRCIRLSV